VLIDERTYTIAPGKLSEYLENHLKTALPIMRVHLGEPLAYYTTETGDLNQFVHLWQYASMADREARREALYRDPAWLAYRRSVGETRWVLHQHNRLLRSVTLPR
jgi:hypothetical protein